MGKHAKLKEKQKWSDEQFHLENARKLRGIYFIDLEDKEFKENPVDVGVPERRDSHASPSHEPSLELAFTRSVDLVNSVYTPFPERPTLRDLS